MRLRNFVYRPYLPGEKVEIAFLFQAGTVWPSWESVYLELKSDSRVSVRFFLDTDTTVEKSHNKGAREFLEEQGIEYELAKEIDWSTYRPHIVFVQFPYDAAFHIPELLSYRLRSFGCRVVYIPYGIEISDTPIARKDHFNSRVVENAWRIYTSSEGIHQKYIKYCRNRNAVRVTGSPKFDCIFNRNKYSLRDEVISKANKRKIVLWKLHFPKKSFIDGEYRLITPEIKEYEQFVEYIRTRTDLFFIVMPHPKLVGSLVASDLQGDETIINAMRSLIENVSSFENVFLDVENDYRSSLYNSDAIIIDRSATMIEAAMLDTPTIIMQNEKCAEPMIKPVQEVIDAVGIGTNFQDMKNFIEERVGDESLNERRKEIVEKWFPFLDGKCGKRIVEEIFDGLAEDNKDSKVKVILYGAGEVSSYYMREQGWDKPFEFAILAVCDSNKNGGDFYGHRVIAANEIINYDYDYIVVMTEPHFYEIQKYLVNDLYISDNQVLRLDEFLYFLEDGSGN